MKVSISVLFFALYVVNTNAQCLTNFSKLIPDKTPNFPEQFGMIVDVYDDIMAIGAPNSDTLGLPSSGIVYLYQKEQGEWRKIGALAPSVPITQGRFGNAIVVSENYILVGGNAVNEGVYIFKKQAGGWQSSTELVLLKPSTTISFGTNFDISEDEQTIVVSDISYSQGAGAFFIFHKQPADEWSNDIIPQIVVNPDKDNNVFYFGIGGIQILGNKIASSTIAGFGAPIGIVYVFSDNTGQFNNFQLEAKLTEQSGSTGGYGPAFILTESGVFKYRLGKFEFYQSPASGVWTDSGPTCEFNVDIIDNLPIVGFQANYTFSGNSLYLSAHLNDQTGRLVKISKTGTNWCGPITQEILYREPQLRGSSLFARSLACYNESEIALSWTSSEVSRTAVAVGSFSKQPDNTWSKQAIVKSRQEANNFQFGGSIWHTEKFLFSGAINERNLDRDPRGAVYIYEKQGDDWIKVNKLVEEPEMDNDQGYGVDIIGFGNYLAVAAFGYADNGLIFLYEGLDGDFTNPQLRQKIEIPQNKVVDRFGNIALNQDFLIVPAATITNSGTENILIFYKRDANNVWNYDREIVLGPVNTFIKRAPAIDLEDNVLISSNGFMRVSIIEYDQSNDTWETKHTLSASDPDADRIFPDFPAVIDGSLFGSSVKLDNDKIFVGAPGKNHNALNDVGAIYVYTKRNGKWYSGTETRKLLPEVKQANLYFGFSLDVLENTLITGAPHTTQPGKVYVLQSKDYFWTNTIQLLMLEGNTFQLDYYGHNVGLTRDDFFITAPFENNSNGLSAGTVYITLPPPIVVLFPPVCVTESPFNLFGYPYDGRWSGNGIVDEVEGLFDPELATPGVYELVYKTDKCFYEGKVEIVVKGTPSISGGSSLQNTICEEGNTEVLLSIVEEQDTDYSWYYREDELSSFILLPDKENELNVTNENPGHYRLEVDNLNCKSEIEFIVEVEDFNLEVLELEEICDSNILYVTLAANVNEGIWQLNDENSALINQITKRLSIATLENGNYPLRYIYTSEAGCMYQKDMALSIQRIIEPEITLTGEVCSTEKQTIEASFSQTGTDYQWYYIPDQNADSVFLSTSDDRLIIENEGYYGIVASRSTCRDVFSAQFLKVREADTIFIPNVFTPNNDSLNDQFKIISNYEYVMLSVYNRWGKLIYSGDGKNGWDGEDAASGVYYWIVSTENCLGEAADYKGWVHLQR